MPLQDLFGSLDNLAGGALSDALSKAAESTSLDETLGNALSEFQDIAGNAEELSAGAEEAFQELRILFRVLLIVLQVILWVLQKS